MFGALRAAVGCGFGSEEGKRLEKTWSEVMWLRGVRGGGGFGFSVVSGVVRDGENGVFGQCFVYCCS